MRHPPPGEGLAPSIRARRAADERRIGRLLIVITYLAVAVLLIGVALMIVGGISPLDGAPAIDPDAIVPALTSLEPAAVLLLGIALVIATPLIRVGAAAVSYARSGELRMLAISVGILIVIGLGVVTAMFLPEA